MSWVIFFNWWHRIRKYYQLTRNSANKIECTPFVDACTIPVFKRNFLLSNPLRHIDEIEVAFRFDVRLNCAHYMHLIIEKSNVICSQQNHWFWINMISIQIKCRWMHSHHFHRLDTEQLTTDKNKKWLNPKWWHFSIENGDQMTSYLSIHSIGVFFIFFILRSLNVVGNELKCHYMNGTETTTIINHWHCAQSILSR